jgi:hypothetical protein
MTANDQNRQDWLNREWDALVRGEEVGINPEYTVLLRGLQRDDPTPGPSPEFVQSLWAELESGTRRSNVRSIRSASRLALVAAAIALLLSAGLLMVLINENAPPDDGLGVIPDPTVTAVIATPTPDISPTMPAQQTPPVAVASPTAPSDATAAPTSDATGAAETPTVDPDATVPTGPAQPAQMGGAPVYTSLADYVNNADLIVIGTVSGPATSDEQGLQYRSLVVDRSVRGEAVEELLLYGMSVSDITVEQYLFFLRGPHEGGVGTFYAIDFFVPLVDGVIQPLDYETVEYHPRADHGGQPVESLIAEIDALPSVEDDIFALLDEYGWTPIRKGYLWPQQLPERDAFSVTGPMPRRSPSWSVLQAASERIGLGFSDLAGQSVALLPFIVERDMVDGEHVIMAELLILDQQVVGAWITVVPHQSGGVFGLDQRDAVFDVPVLIPTPEPTPTIAIPDGDTVNPSEFYRLAETETFMLCWPYCDETPVTVAFRDSIVAALNRELAIQPLETHPTPTPPGELEQATGEYVWIVFGYLEPGSYAVAFGYDRENGLLLLPYGAGWVPAPPELAAALEDVEPLPPLTKPT